MNQQDLTAYEALTKRHALLKKKFELLEQQEKAIFSDKTMAMDGISEKLNEELADAENDLAFLKQRPAKERMHDDYQAAYAAATERKSDIELTMELLQKKKAKLEDGNGE